MWVYGNHYRMEDEIGDCHKTYDSGFFCIFIQGSYSFAQGRNVVMATLRYVGVLKEIFVISYATMKWHYLGTHQICEGVQTVQ
jgi:hypothetical protein